jgi:integrase/recombinase XerD
MTDVNENQKLISKFKNELNIEGYSSKTIEIYSMYVTLFYKYIKKDLINITTDEIIEYLSFLKSEKKAESTTMNLVLSSLKHFYSNFLKKDLDLNIKLPKKSKKIPTVLTSKEIILLLENITNKRNKLITQFIFSTGVRISECMEMKIKDLDFNESTGRVISGKGNKDRIIILSKKWIVDYKGYLEQRSKKIKSEYLFCNGLGEKLSVDTVQKFLKDASMRAGIEKKVSPHTLRHSFATNLLENDVNIRYIQQLLGHSNLNTTQIYTKVNTNKLKIIKNPLDNL